MKCSVMGNNGSGHSVLYHEKTWVRAVVLDYFLSCPTLGDRNVFSGHKEGSVFDSLCVDILLIHLPKTFAQNLHSPKYQ